MAVQTTGTGSLAGRVRDARVEVSYYVRGSTGVPLIDDLLARATTVFDIKHLLQEVCARPPQAGLLPAGRIDADARLSGQVVVADGARIEAGAIVHGPVLVCAGSVIGAGAHVRDHSVIGPDCAIGFGAEITRSLLVGGIFMKHASFIGDSVIGRGVNVGAFVSTTALRIDAGPVAEPATKEITINLDGRRIGTGHTKFGAVVGDGVVLPAGTILQPGTLIGPGSLVFPRGNQVGGFIPAGSQAR